VLARGDDDGPREPLADDRRGRDDDARRRPTLGRLVVELDEQAVVQHPDRELGTRGGDGLAHGPTLPARATAAPRRLAAPT
jgi:hypothetical protein